MNVLMKPLVRLMGRMKYKQKLYLMALAVIVPFSLLAVYWIQDIEDDSRRLRIGRESLLVHDALVQVYGDIQIHRDFAGRVSADPAAVQEKRKELQAGIDTKLAALGHVLRQTNAPDSVTEEWRAVSAYWNESTRAEAAVSPAEAVSAHSKTLSAIYAMMIRTAERSGLGHSADPATERLAEAALTKLPVVISQADDLRTAASSEPSLGAEALSSRVKQPAEEAVSKLLQLREGTLKQIPEPQTQQRLNQALESAVSAFTVLSAKRPAPAFEASLTRLDKEQLDSLSREAVKKVYDVYAEYSRLLDDTLKQRAARLRSGKVVVVLFVIAGQLASILLFAAIYKSVIGSVAELKRVSRRIASGDLSARVRLHARDELREVETAFNRVIDSFDQTMSERKLEEEQMRHKAYYDALTGLPNRFLLQDRLRTAISHASRQGGMLAVLFIDLDGFKHINDTLGHRTGDMLLHAIAGRLRSRLRESDTVSRVGGDEFIILLPDLSERQVAAYVARKLVDEMSKAFVFEGQELFVSASVGISLYPGDGTDSDTLLQKADSAMYRVKSNGKNNVQLIDTEDKGGVQQKLNLENELRIALDKGQFHVVYQPIVGAESGTLAGIEALLRWNHPRRGLLYPADFMEVAQQSGLIVRMDEYTLAAACRQMKGWKDGLGWNVPVSVNLCLHPEWRGRLADKVSELLTASGLHADQLVVEFTENRVFQNLDETLHILKSLRLLGVRILLDDFGTGFSSFTHLKKLPIDGLKIDRTFVKDIPHGLKDSAITASTVTLAKQLHMRVVAEGVETEEQLQYLKQIGCGEIQGYIISKPETAGVIASRFR
ncbi:MAG: hypothetical protein K0Q94_405 [Paenibacillus sp.]|nr:hypothetical protein [Paenibacillus sp.]